uniref:Guanine nucleotide-binding protein-like NSN1 n=1 Tax=Tanacetum cinerariifolium TaxID=118510 RepID=A0A699GNX5_TANCI|nr:guanine nucleotide-binding protein-like NSN1 [Tanacetum cinerariifolium]
MKKEWVYIVEERRYDRDSNQRVKVKESLKQKHKVIEKDKEHHKKKAKEVKKLGLSKIPKVEKDLGIPNDWPFKEFASWLISDILNLSTNTDTNPSIIVDENKTFLYLRVNVQRNRHALASTYA